MNKNLKLVRQIFSNTMIVVLSITICLLFLELTLRIYNSFIDLVDSYPNVITYESVNPNSPHIYDSVLGWSLKPGYKRIVKFSSSEEPRKIGENGIVINQDGFRTSIKKSIVDLDKSKILVLGDSMVFGLSAQQEEIFTEKLNAKQKKVIFVNAGVSGYSTAQEYLVLQKYIAISNVKMVILFHTLSNDMWMNVQSGGFNPSVKLNDGQLVFTKPSPMYSLPLYKRTMLFKFANKQWLRGRDLIYLFHRLDFEIRGSQSDVWKIQSKLIQEMSNLAKQSSIPLVVIDIPTQNQLNKSITSQKRQHLMSQLCKDNQITYYSLIDLYPKEWSNLFVKNDTHWNDLGHTFVANFIENVVLKN